MTLSRSVRTIYFLYPLSSSLVRARARRSRISDYAVSVGAGTAMTAFTLEAITAFALVSFKR